MTHPEPAERPTAPSVAHRLGELNGPAAVLPTVPVVVGVAGDDEPTSVIPGAGGPPTGASTAAMSVEARGEPTSVFPAAAAPGAPLHKPGRRGLIWVVLAALALVIIGAALSANDPDLPTPTTTATEPDPTTTTTEAVVVAPPSTAPPPTAGCNGEKKGHGEGKKGDGGGDC